MLKLSSCAFIAGIFLSMAQPFAHAQVPATPQEVLTPTPSPAPVEGIEASPNVPPAAVANKVEDRQVPMVTVRWECAGCVVNEKVAPLIQTNYGSAAVAQGYALSGAEMAEVVITEYRQRPPGVRVMFGFMAGKDILTTRVTFRGKSFVASDYSANAWVGMNGLCESIAQDVLKQIIASIQSK